MSEQIGAAALQSGDFDDLDGSVAHPGMVAYVETVSRNECLNMLARTSVGRLGLVVDGEPVIVPVRYGLDGDSILFRTAPAGGLAGATVAAVAFEIDYLDPTRRAGWSVVVRGRAEDISDAADATSRRLRRLELASWDPDGDSRWYVIRPQAITGRRIRVIPPDL
jgi:nitroimidazol reductase NimA-like FMN-containing flavoprotein (pyridoxamine 5'-phosphate oxidase superfamily)